MKFSSSIGFVEVGVGIKGGGGGGGGAPSSLDCNILYSFPRSKLRPNMVCDPCIQFMSFSSTLIQSEIRADIRIVSLEISRIECGTRKSFG